jgi:error-prone DNA polymerase
MGFYAPAQLIQDARRHGVPVRPADVNASDADSTLEPTEMGDALRLGLNLVNRLPEEAIGRILEGRRTGPYRDMDDFARRTGLERPVLNLLAEADAFESLQLGRRAALWDALAQDNRAMPLFDAAPTQQPAPQTQFLARMTLFEETAADYGALGFSLKDHPMRFLRPMLEKNRVVPAADLEKRPDGRRVKVAGLVLNRQRPGTAKGVIFITLEDETGQANLIIRPDVAARYRQVVRGAMVILADGRLQKKDGVIHVLPARVEDWSGALAAVKTKSRDFQ